EVRTKRNNFYDNSGKEKKLFDLLLSQTEPSIVYVKSPGEAYKLANEYFEFLKEKQIELATLGNNDLLEWIDVNISPQWELRDLL
ncbi:TPA: helicase, partial [Streptococcus suis]